MSTTQDQRPIPADEPSKRSRIRVGLRLFMLLCFLASIVAAWLGLRVRINMMETQTPNTQYMSMGPDGGVLVDSRGVAHVAFVNGQGIHRLSDRAAVYKICLGEARVEDLAVLAGFPALRSLHLNRPEPKLTSEAVSHLARCTRLEHLSAIHVRDADLEHFDQLAGLERLHLDLSPVSDAGVEHLAELKNLRILSIHGAKMTPEGIARLRAALPRCNVVVETASR